MFESIAPPPELDDKKKQSITQMIRADMQGVDEGRQDWLDGIALWRQAAISSNLGERKLPWPNASDHRHDLIPDEIDDFVARGMNKLFGDQFWAPAKPRTEYAADAWNTVEHFMQWALETDLNFWPKASDILRSTATDGVCFTYTYWHRIKRNVQYLKDALIVQEVAGRPVRMSKQKLAQSMVTPDEFKSITNLGDSFEILKRNGEKLKVWVADFGPDDTHAKIEIRIRETVKDRPEIRITDPSRTWVPELGTLEDIPFATVEFDVTLDWLRQQWNDGAFNVASEEDWTKIVDAHLGTGNTNEAEDSGTKKLIRDTFNTHQINAGVDAVIGVDTLTSHSKTRPVRVSFYQYDLDGDGEVEDVMFMMDPETDVLLVADYRSRRVDHGKLPLTLFQFIRIQNRTYVPGLPFMLMNSAVMINTLINQAIDSQTLANLKWGAYDQSAAPELADRGTIPLDPGTLIGLQGPPREILDIQSFQAQDMDKLMPFVGKIEEFARNRAGGGGAFGPSSRSGQNHTSPRTFGGTNVQLIESHIRQAFLFSNIANGLKDLYGQIFALYSKLMPPTLKFRVAGKKGFEFMDISREDLQDQPDFIFAINALSGNAAVRRQDALLLFQTVGPFLSQLGAQAELQELLERFLRAYDEPKPEGLIPSLPNMMKRAPMSQMEEDAQLLQGRPVDILPVDDDAQHLMAMEEMDKLLAESGYVIQPDMLKERETHRFQHIAQLEQKMQAGPGAQGDQGGRPLGGERRLPGQGRPQRGPGGGVVG